MVRGERKKAAKAAACVAAAVLLTACSLSGQKDRPEETKSTLEESEKPDSQTQAAAADPEAAGEAAKEESAGETEYATGFQLVEGYGICAPGSAPVYVMEEEPEPIETEGAKAWLTAVMYQEGRVSYRITVEDSSITVIPEEEMKALLRKEEENQALQEAGMPVPWDPGYFAIDEEKGIYGRSAFESRADSKRDYIEGQGLHAGSNASISSVMYEEFLTKGYVTSYYEYFSDQCRLSIPEPLGDYKIHVPGFEEDISFTFKRAREYKEPEDIPGMHMEAGWGIAAQGRWTEEGLGIRIYTWPKEDYSMTIRPSQLVCGKGSSSLSVESVPGPYFHTDPDRGPVGMPKGRPAEYFQFDIPKEYRDGSFRLLFDTVYIQSGEEGECVTIPVSADEISLDKEIRFRDSTLHLISAKALENPYFYGNINGQDIKKPAVYVTAECALQDSTMFLRGEAFSQTNPQEIARSYERAYVSADYGPGDQGAAEGVLQGFYAFYDQGETATRIYFQYPSYIWKHHFSVDVRPY